MLAVGGRTVYQFAIRRTVPTNCSLRRRRVEYTIHQFDEADPLGDLDAFAAKVAALDLVISIGNATVHLSRALGVPTWCLVPFVPQWRWGIAGETTPWYPSVQIIRQTAGYDWTSALAETANRLKAFIAHPRRNEPAPRSGQSKIAAPAVSKPVPSKSNNSPTTLVRQATQLFNENRIDEAAQIAEQILKLDSANVPAIRILGVAARKAQQFERSLELLSRAVELAPGSAAVHFEQGLTFAEMKQQRDAYDCFVKSTQCKPPLQPAFVNISAILEQQERYEESLQWARKAIELKSDCPLGHYNLANSLRECGRIADAIVQYELAVKYRPDYAKAKWNLGICHVLLGNFAKAWPFFELRDVAEEVKLDQFTQPRWMALRWPARRLLFTPSKASATKCYSHPVSAMSSHRPGKLSWYASRGCRNCSRGRFPKRPFTAGRGEKIGRQCRWPNASTAKFRPEACLFIFAIERTIFLGENGFSWSTRHSSNIGVNVSINLAPV